MDKDVNYSKTSIQYYLSNIYLFNKLFYEFEDLMSVINSGPEVFKKNLVEYWNESKDKLALNENLEIEDRFRVVTENDFDVTYNKSDSGSMIFYVTFPDSELYNAESKCVALALTKGRPRYFTMEYFKSFTTGDKGFVYGEFFIDDANHVVGHKNYGARTNVNIANFSYFVREKVSNEE